jgi:nucleoside-diphosphate-sugar epimerase
MDPKKYLVTGATGFLGRHLLHAMAAKAESMHPLALVRNPAAWEKMDWTGELGRVDIIAGSVMEPEKWQDDARLNGLSGIFHLAAIVRHSREDSEEMYHTNVEGLAHMVRLAAKYRCRVVYVSTSGTVGCFRNPEEWADEHSPYCEQEVSRWPYYDSKIQAERKAVALAGQLGVELVIVRPPVLLGPGDHRFRATGPILRLLQGRLPFILKGGIHFVDVRDAAQAMIRAMALAQPRPIYHLTGTECSIPEFFSLVGEIAGIAPPKIKLPPHLAKLVAAAASQLEALLPKRSSPLLPDPVVFEMAAKHWGLRSRYAEQDLGYAPRDARQTLSDTIRWLRENGAQKK